MANKKAKRGFTPLDGLTALIIVAVICFIGAGVRSAMGLRASHRLFRDELMSRLSISDDAIALTGDGGEMVSVTLPCPSGSCEIHFAEHWNENDTAEAEADRILGGKIRYVVVRPPASP